MQNSSAAVNSESLFDDFWKSAVHAAIESPVTALGLLHDPNFNWEPVIPGATKPGSLDYFVQGAGSSMGMLVDFAAARFGLSAFGKSSLATNLHVDTALKNPIGLTASTGALYGGLLTPVDAGYGGQLESRLKNAALSAGVFATMHGVSNKLSPFANSEVPLYRAAQSIGINAALGAPIGVIGVQAQSLLFDHRLAGLDQSARAGIDGAVISGTLGASSVFGARSSRDSAASAPVIFRDNFASGINAHSHTRVPVREVSAARIYSNEPPRGIAEGTSKPLAPKLKIQFKSGSLEFRDFVLDEIRQIPKSHRELLANAGIRFTSVDKISDFNKALLRRRPDGHPVGSSWDDVDGGYFDNRKTVVVAENTNAGQSRRVDGVLKHETGHAVDAALGYFSHSRAFRRAYSLDKSNLTESERANNEYLLLSRGVGQEETFAEVYGALHGSSTNWHQTEEVLRDFPHVVEAVKSKLANL